MPYRVVKGRFRRPYEDAAGGKGNDRDDALFICDTAELGQPPRRRGREGWQDPHGAEAAEGAWWCRRCPPAGQRRAGKRQLERPTDLDGRHHGEIGTGPATG